MKRKVFGILLTMTMVMSLLVGCGEAASENAANENAANANNVSVSQEIGSSEQEVENSSVAEQPTGESEAAVEANPYAEYTFSLCCDQELKQSAVVSYNPEKVALLDLSGNAAQFQWLDKKDASVLLMCENTNLSVEDLYQREMKSLENDVLSVSELTEKEVGNYTVLRSDGVWNPDGIVGFEFFALQLENDMILYAVYLPGFENPVPLDEMLPYILANVTVGDGTRLKPASMGLPNGTTETPEGIKWDTFFEVTSVNGVKVKVYYNPDVVMNVNIMDPEFYLTDADGNQHCFAIADFESAEARRQGMEEYFNSQKVLKDVYVSDLSESSAGEYTIKSYRADYMMFAYDGSGALNPASSSEGVIELGSGVVCVFDDTYLFENPEFGVFFNAIEFVVE